VDAIGNSPKKAVDGPVRRRKHVPQRTCVSCRRTLAKRELIRIVHTPEGSIEVDLKGKRAGRGAYICHQQECWEAALGQGILGRALKVRVAGEQLTELRAQLASIVEQVSPVK
jgi:predicted RNA-binding protein YlxR (DUF448 family)